MSDFSSKSKDCVVPEALSGIAKNEELVSAPDSLVDVLVIPADEERAVAAELLGFEGKD